MEPVIKYLSDSEGSIHNDDYQAKVIDICTGCNLDIFCSIYNDDLYYRVNQKFVDTFGYTEDEIGGKSFYEFIHEEDVSYTKDVIRMLKADNSSHRFKNRHRCKDGSYKIIEWNIKFDNGTYAYITGRDVTNESLYLKDLIEKNNQLSKKVEELEKKNLLLRDIAIKDKLTGLYNRHIYDKKVEEEIIRADRYSIPLSMILMDIDDFKNVNDTYGHQIGDEVLKNISSLISSIVRKSDLLVRYGGEEFLLLMPETNLKGAVFTAIKIMDTVNSYEHSIAGKVTISMGIAERESGESQRIWYKRADKALYEAKENGKNRFIVSESRMKNKIAEVHILWKDKWNSGNDLIDKDHKMLIKMGNDLINVLFMESGFDIGSKYLDELLEHIVTHFKNEEKILASVGFVDLDKHKMIHDGLVKRALQLKDYYLNKSLRLWDLFSFIVDDVIINHLEKEDVKFFSYLSNSR